MQVKTTAYSQRTVNNKVGWYQRLDKFWLSICIRGVSRKTRVFFKLLNLYKTGFTSFRGRLLPGEMQQRSIVTG